MLQRAVHEHPDSGLAPHALRQYLRWLQQREGTASVLSYLDQTLAQVRSEELTEHLHYAYAGALADLGRTRAARDRYLYVAKRFPYPHGALWDDALWHASHLEEKLGRYRAAIRHLKRMLAEREPPSAPGTYQRPRYAESQFRIAVLYRDQLHDLDAAYREFWRVYRDHADSRLRDDALWEAALAARARGKRAHTCAALERLLLDFPDSRYTPCLHWLCARLRHDADRSCRSYLRQQIREGLD
jgi:tetratricopeptide (TPR) repeat protein